MRVYGIVHPMAQTYEGAIKTAAKKIGVTVVEYKRWLASGRKWCGNCRAWQLQNAFGKDISRWDGMAAVCLESKRDKQRAAYTPKPRQFVKGRSFVPARDGDKKQARGRVNYFVECGLLPRPNSLPCVDCGHIYGERPSRRHEYDHFLGYAAEHHEHVQPVCSRCHRTRAIERGEWPRKSNG